MNTVEQALRKNNQVLQYKLAQCLQAIEIANQQLIELMSVANAFAFDVAREGAETAGAHWVEAIQDRADEIRELMKDDANKLVVP